MFQMLQGGLEAAKVLDAGAGESFAMLGIRFSPKVTAEDSGGAFSLIEQRVMPQAGSPAHICHNEDKSIYVAEGEFELLVGDAPHVVRAGGVVYIPRGTLHSFRNVGGYSGTLMVMMTPGGHEHFLRRISEVINSEAPDPVLMADICRASAVEMIV